MANRAIATEPLAILQDHPGWSAGYQSIDLAGIGKRNLSKLLGRICQVVNSNAPPHAPLETHIDGASGLLLFA
ncbi:hypothetical protein [Granulicella arctica]|uniref:hypothetical protein n=1 Tax=Granulicella arctica TaxID=940613 RepID=UPI0021DF7354|nr:hypothetical protein [Granulicella arctica]